MKVRYLILFKNLMLNGINEMKYSANLGLLWTEMKLEKAIFEAKKNAFDAVELWWPYEEDPKIIRNASEKTGLPILCLNTVKGNLEKGDFGLSALPNRKKEAKEAIKKAAEYAEKIRCKNIHLLAGIVDFSPSSLTTLLDNLKYARDICEPKGIGILIEPKNRRDIPKYFISTIEQGCEIIDLVDSKNVKLIFDFYHIQINQGDLMRNIEKYISFIGHFQIASMPQRNEPIDGEINYKWVIPQIDKLGYNGYAGAEYKPKTNTNEGIAWLKTFRQYS